MNEQDKRVRDYYSKVFMPSEKLDQLVAMGGLDDSEEHAKAQAAEPVLERTGNDKNRSSGFAKKSVAADGASDDTSFSSRFLRVLTVPLWHPALKAIAAGVLVMMVSLWMHNTGTETQRMQLTVKEVAMNHTTRLEPEYRGESLASLDNSMQQLPFALVLPKTLTNTYELVGSRYCSLGGALAAHVKFKEKSSGRPMSLFVTANSTELGEIPAQQTTHEGVAVEFWKEGGLFFAMAERT